MNINLLLIFVPSVLYALQKTNVLVVLELLGGVVLLVAGVLLAARWQAQGMAIAVVVQQFVLIVAVIGYFVWFRPWQQPDASPMKTA